MYAIQAGREIRIFVTPDKIDDISAQHLARRIANRIQDELKISRRDKSNAYSRNAGR